MPFRLTAIAFVLAAFGPLVAVSLEPVETKRPVPMVAEDGKTYLVEPEESLGSAMNRGPIHATHAAQSEPEQGACVPEPMEDKPADSVACRCYEVTQCKGNESHECKRHCRKDLCQCCDI
jgi:hypothetical protein